MSRVPYVSQWQKSFNLYNKERKCPECGGYVLLGSNWSDLLYECVDCGWREYE